MLGAACRRVNRDRGPPRRDLRQTSVMSFEQGLILAILGVAIGLFVWGRWRHDLVAGATLLACVLAGLVNADAAFAGFGHPAVVTVAAVLVMSRALQQSGAVDAMARRLLPAAAGPALTVAVLTVLAAVLSGFMNNVGALALLMPIAIQAAAKLGIPAGRLLMPLAFGSILGGMTTLIGTPTNLIVSGFRAEASGAGFRMFDFAPVGLGIAAAGVVFIVLLGWRLVPARQRASVEGFDTGRYFTELRIGKASKSVGRTLAEVDQMLGDGDAQVIGLIRAELRITAPMPYRKLQAGDILIIEADPEALGAVLSTLDLQLEEADSRGTEAAASAEAKVAEDEPPAEPASGGRAERDEIALVELAVLPGSSLGGRSATQLDLRTRFGLNLLALSRAGQRSITRLKSTPIRAGDVLLMQGPMPAVAEFAADFGCVPLADRALRIPDRRKAMLSVASLLGAVAAAAFGWLPAAVAFATGALAVVVLDLVPLRKVYESVDWSVIVLLAALMPVAGAMESTGAAGLIADVLLNNLAQGSPVVALGLILIVTMTLSDFMNNAATAAVMCPVALGAAMQLGVGADPFLMAVAVGGSCAFLTPIGHQNNTLIMGPGGFRFTDYLRLGLPVELLVIGLAIPLLLWAWPL
jgi:di/tricarboxylate transporter